MERRGNVLSAGRGFHSSLQDNRSHEPTLRFTSSMVACPRSTLLPETKRVAWCGRGEHKCREGGEATIPLALLSSVRWRGELIPGLSRMSPSTAPSRVSEGPPWRICPSMWPSQRPPGAAAGPSQSHHVAFTFCAGGPAGPSLAAGAAKAQTFFLCIAAAGLLHKCLLPRRTVEQLRVSKLHITVHFFQRPLTLLALSPPAKSPDSYLGGADRQAAKPTLAFGSAAVQAAPSERCTFRAFGSPRLDEPSVAAA